MRVYMNRKPGLCLISGFAVLLSGNLLFAEAANAAAQTDAAAGAASTENAPAITERSPTFHGHELGKHALIHLRQARLTAIKARPGQIVDEELEKEKGGSGLRYSFDVKADDVTYEVGVDAKTGKILENAPEGKHPD